MSRSVLLALVTAALAGTRLVAQGPPDVTRTFSAPAAYAPDPDSLSSATSELRDLVDRYSSDRAALLRFHTIPGSATRRATLRGFYDAWLGTLGRLDFEKLSREGRVDYVLLRSRIDYEVALLGREDRVQRQIAGLVPFSPRIVGLSEDRQRLDFIAADAAADAVEEIATLVARASATAAPGVAPPATAVRAAQEVDTLTAALADWFKFYDGYDPRFTSAVAAKYEPLAKDLEAYAAALREKVAGLPPGAGRAGGEERGSGPGRTAGGPASENVVRSSEGPIVGDPIGREGLLEDLRGEMIAYAPEQLVEIGNREYAWCEIEAKKAARELGFGDDWKKALEHVKRIYVPRGEQPRLVRNLALQALDFVKQRDLLTVPPLAQDVWRMTMMSPAAMRVNPFFLGGEVIQVSYPTTSMSEADASMVMRGNGPHMSHATVFHELIPGHELQGFMAQRYNTHRSAFRTPFLTEGWALYWEFLMWDEGFHASPEDRIGALFWRMHRCARIVFSLNFHLGRWTPEQCIQYLVDRVGHDRFTAEGEVRRSFNGAYSPLYQLAYMMGALQVRSLMRELVDSKRMTIKQFNDAFLREGSMPIEIMRAALAGTPLTRDYRANWKFYGEVPAAQPSAPE